MSQVVSLSSPFLLLRSASSLTVPFSTANFHLHLAPPRTATCPSFPPRRRFTFQSTLPATFRRERLLPCCSSSSMPVELSTSSSQDDHLRDSLLYSRAYWVSESVIAWNVDVPDGSCYLYASKTAALSVTYDGVQGEDVRIELQKDSGGIPANVKG